MKVALVHPWLTNTGGAERLLLEVSSLYPDAPIYTSVYNPHAMPAFEGKDIRTTWMQKLPFWRFKQQVWSPIRPLAFRMLDLSEFDVVISIDTAEAKNVRVRSDAVHVCYCNSPVRYYWSHYSEYKRDPGFGLLNPLIRLIMPLFVGRLRKTDYKASQKVDYFISNSTEIKHRVRTFYHRKSVVINPPVDAARFRSTEKTGRKGFVIASRQTTYKRVDLAIQACNELELQLTVIGDGTEHEKLKKMAGPTIRMLGAIDDQEIVKEFQAAEAFIFPAEEDFGIVPIEAMSAGLPVVAFGKGGVVDWMIEGKTGEVFHTQSVAALKKALKDFDPSAYNKQFLADHAESFNAERFRLEIAEFVDGVRPKESIS